MTKGSEADRKCPLFTQYRPETGSRWRSQLGQQLTHAPQQRLLDDLVRQRAQPVRHSQSERLGGLHVDHQHELDRSLNRKLARLLAFEDGVGIGRCTPVLIDENRTVRDQAAEFSELTGPRDDRNSAHADVALIPAR